jgi:hypothetical protein
MSCVVQTEVEDTDDIAALLEVLQSEGSAAILIGSKSVPKGKKAQKDLDLAPTANVTADQAAAGEGADAVH